MSFSTALIDSGQIHLEVDVAQRDRLWQQSQAFATPVSRWNAYLNGMAIAAILPWLREEGMEPRFNAAAAKHQWELVGGSLLQLGSKQQPRRLVILAEEQLDQEEWTVPQEWVDSPNLAADYFLAAQVNPDDSSVRLLGFTTQPRLKAQGQLDFNQRLYSLDQAAWLGDLGLLSLALEVPVEPRTAPIAPAELSVEAANNLIERLGNPSQLTPRLEIPFDRWAALLAHGGWQQRLAEQRRGQPEQRSILDWVRNGLSNLGLSEGWSNTAPSLVPAIAGVRRLASLEGAAVDEQGNALAIGRPLTIEGNAYQLNFIALDLETNRWRIELRGLDGSMIQANWALRVFSENLQDFEGNEDRAETEQTHLYLDLQLAPGEGIVWETTPHAEGYIPEILRF
jgi:hypothetical protein